MVLSVVVTVNFPGSSSFGVDALDNRSGQKKEWVEKKILFKTCANTIGLHKITTRFSDVYLSFYFY